MTTTEATTDRARAHYEQMLAEASAPDEVLPAPVVIPLDVDGDPAFLEVCNTEVGERHEVFELGPFGGNWYLRIRATDLAVFFGELRRLADDGLTALMDERDAKARADMVECPGCPTLIGPDDVSCGYQRCERIAAVEARL